MHLLSFDFIVSPTHLYFSFEEIPTFYALMVLSLVLVLVFIGKGNALICCGDLLYKRE